MIIGVPTESYPSEARVALVPKSVEKLIELGHSIQVQSGCGQQAGYSDDEYRSAGATVFEELEALAEADLVTVVRGVLPDGSRDRRTDGAKAGQIWVGLFDPLWRPQSTAELAAAGLCVLSLEMMPRISRAQSMDVLSSMATLGGYKAVLLAAMHLPKMFPMMMTAAGTLTAAQVFVIGAGVAGLQAIATARRLGAHVEGYDIRPAAAEQIKSLGAKSIELPLESTDSEDAGGYARAQGEDFQRRQQQLLQEVVAGKDIVITTAAVPGARSPVLLTRDMVEGMKPGSVIVDLGAERGGNCELTQPDELVEHGGVKIFGPTELPSSLSRHASQMFSNNVTSMLKHLTHEGQVQLDLEDEITRETMVAQGGEVIHPRIRDKLGLEPLPELTAASEEAAN